MLAHLWRSVWGDRGGRGTEGSYERSYDWSDRGGLAGFGAAQVDGRAEAGDAAPCIWGGRLGPRRDRAARDFERVALYV